MKRGFICEKGSALKALKPHLRPGDVVVAASGHLFATLEPDEISEKWKGKWRDTFAALPIAVDHIPLKVGEDRDGKSFKPRLAEMKDRVAGVDVLINATDPGREGSLIFKEIKAWLGWKGRCGRLYLGATDDHSIKAAMAAMDRDLAEAADYAVALEAECRQFEDWHMGMNGTRVCTIKLKPDQIQGVWTFGGVQTATLALLAAHEAKVSGHVVQAFYKIALMVEASVGGHEILLVHDPKEKIFDQGVAEDIRAAAAAWSGPLSVERRDVATTCPQLHSGDTLALRCAKAFGWSPDKTLQLQQKLYDAGYLSYPRTESRLLPESQMKDAPAVLAAIAKAIPELGKLIPSQPVFRKGRVYVPEVGEHQAVGPTRKAPDMASLSPDERALYDLVARSFLAAHLPDAVDFRTTIRVSVKTPHGAKTFSATGAVPKQAGWRSALGEDEEFVPGRSREKSSDGKVADVSNGAEARAKAAEAVAGRTQPPPRITLGELPIAMGKLIDQVDDPALKAALENPANPNEPKGLGTVATRKTIAPKLLKAGYVTLEGANFEVKGERIELKGGKKDPPIVVTEIGLKFIEAVRAAFPEFADPVTRARFEAELAEIGRAPDPAEADRRAAEFRRRTHQKCTAMVAAAKGQGPVQLSDKTLRQAGAPSAEMRTVVMRVMEKTGTKPPVGWRTDRAIAGAYLDQHGDAPSDKSLALAERYARVAGVPLDDAARASQRRISAFIEEMKKRGVELGASEPPSPVALAMAERHARAAGEELPEAARTSAAECSAYIEAKKAAGIDPPTEEMLAWARKIAAESDSEVPAAVLQGFKACRAYLDEHFGKRRKAGS